MHLCDPTYSAADGNHSYDPCDTLTLNMYLCEPCVSAWNACPAGCTSLLVLDAKSWTEVARARLPYGAPYRFHGSWIPA
jgi:hypothetical protein